MKSAFVSVTGIERGLYIRKKKKNLIPLINIKTNPSFSLFFLLMRRSHKKEAIVTK